MPRIPAEEYELQQRVREFELFIREKQKEYRALRDSLISMRESRLEAEKKSKTPRRVSKKEPREGLDFLKELEAKRRNYERNL